MMKDRSRLFSLIIVSVFMLSIFTPLAGAIWQEDKGLSYTEKRKLQQLPPFPRKIGELEDFIGDFEKYYNDQFGLRSLFITGYAMVKKLLGDYEISSPAKNVGTKNIVRGKKGWFFLNRKWDGDPISDYRNIHLYSSAELWRATLIIAARADWLKAQGIEYLLFFAPNKHTVYSEYLPDYIQKEGDISSWDQLNDSLNRFTSVNYVDLRKILQQGKREAPRYWKDKKEEAALYYKKDSHWNGAGADIAQYAIAQKIEQMFPGKIHPAKRPPDDFEMFSFTGDITLIMGGKKKEAYGPVLMRGTCTPETAWDYLKRKHETACSKAVLTALIFHDSFFPPLKPYFADYFRRAVFRWERMNQIEVEKQIQITKPDIVIEQRAERHLPFTPDITHEDYSGFWGKNWERWQDTIFKLDLKSVASGNYQSSNIKMKYLGEEKGVEIKALSDDPMLFLPKIEYQQDRLYMVKIKLTSEHDALLQLFYSIAGGKESFPAERNSVLLSLKKGENTLFIPFFSMNLAGEMRFDPGNKAGRYRLQSFEIKEVSPVRLE